MVFQVIIKSPDCPQLINAPRKPSVASTLTSTVPSTTRSGTTFMKPSMKSVGFTNESSSSSSSSSSSDILFKKFDVSFKTLDRTIPIDLCSLSVNDKKTLLPIYINGELFFGLPDTGASSSCIDLSLTKRLNIPIIKVKGKILVADINHQPDRIGQCNITAKIMIPNNNNMILFQHTFEVFPIFEKDKGYHFMIGRDILSSFFANDLPSSLFAVDPHVKTPTIIDEHSSITHTSSSSSPINVSSVLMKRFEIINDHDSAIININLKQVSIINDGFNNLENNNEYKILQDNIADDIKLLSKDIHDLGAGVVPDLEIPIRPSVLSDTSSSTVSSSLPVLKSDVTPK